MVVGGAGETWCRWGRRCGRCRGQIRTDATAPSSATRLSSTASPRLSTGLKGRMRDGTTALATSRHPRIGFSGNPATTNACDTGHARRAPGRDSARQARVNVAQRSEPVLKHHLRDHVQRVACDLLAERRICDLVDARPEEAYAPPNQAVICWQAGKQEQGIQN